jgi:hypothetical protein
MKDNIVAAKATLSLNLTLASKNLFDAVYRMNIQINGNEENEEGPYEVALTDGFAVDREAFLKNSRELQKAFKFQKWISIVEFLGQGITWLSVLTFPAASWSYLSKNGPKVHEYLAAIGMDYSLFHLNDGVKAWLGVYSTLMTLVLVGYLCVYIFSASFIVLRKKI